MKFGYVTDDPLDVYGRDDEDPEADGEEFIEPRDRDDRDELDAVIDDHYLLTAFPISGVGFTAPKGHIKLTMNVHGSLLEEVAQIVRHSGEMMQVLIFAPKKPFE